jgi:hypothetical protein
LCLGVGARRRVVEDALAAVPVLLRALLVDEFLLLAVHVGADEVVGVLDDVVEEVERADGIQLLATGWSA